MSLKARCGNCNAWLKGPRDGACRANPPQVILLGMQQARPAVDLPGIRAASQAQPVTATFFPQMKESGWCRAWEPVAELEAAFMAEAHKEANGAVDAAC